MQTIFQQQQFQQNGSLPVVPPSRQSQGSSLMARLSRGPPAPPPSRGSLVIRQPSEGLPMLPPPPGPQHMPPPPPPPSIMSPVGSVPPPGPPPHRASLTGVPPMLPPGLEPPPGLGSPKRRTLIINQQDQPLSMHGGGDMDKWENQSVSSFTSTATSKSQTNRCRCEKCKMERRASHRQSMTTHVHRGRKHRHKRKSIATRVTQAVFFPITSCIST